VVYFRMYYTISCNTQSSAPEDGRDHRPKHVELIGVINKPLLLHLVGVYIIYKKSILICGLFPDYYTTSCNTQSSAPEDGRDHRPKYVELLGIMNKPLLLHLVGVYIIYKNSIVICGLFPYFLSLSRSLSAEV